MSFIDSGENGYLQQPQAYLQVNGTNVAVESCEVHLVRLSQTGTFEASMALDDPSNPGAAFWASAAPIQAAIIATQGLLTGGGLTTLIQGKITKVHLNFGTRTVLVEGSDAVQDMINNRNDQNYANQPTSAVVSQIAAENGLGVVIEGASDMAGRTYDYQNYNYVSDNQSQWDVIQHLAKLDGNIAFVSNNILYYVNPGNTTGSTFVVTYVPPTPLSPVQSNSIRLTGAHDLEYAQGVQVTSNAWHSFQKAPNTATAGGGAAQIYVKQPGLTQSQSQNKATLDQFQAASQEYTIECEVPGNVTVNPTMMLQIVGTGTAFDLTYYIRSVIHRFNIEGGYLMEIEGYNTSAGGAGYAPSSNGEESPSTGMPTSAATPDSEPAPGFSGPQP